MYTVLEAIKLQCDRCGLESYQIDGSTHDEDDFEYDRCQIDYMRTVRSGNSVVGDRKRIDLCRRCIADFKKFMDEKKVEIKDSSNEA